MASTDSEIVCKNHCPVDPKLTTGLTNTTHPSAHEPWRILPLCPGTNGRDTGELGKQLRGHSLRGHSLIVGMTSKSLIVGMTSKARFATSPSCVESRTRKHKTIINHTQNKRKTYSKILQMPSMASNGQKTCKREAYDLPRETQDIP